MFESYLNTIWCGDALRLLTGMPSQSVDACITDAMFGTAKDCEYDWGLDPGMGDPAKHWALHEPIYHECRRVLGPGGVLAWGQGVKFCSHNPIEGPPDVFYDHYKRWFGPHRKWTLIRMCRFSKQVSGHLWIVQTREQQPIEFPHQDSVLIYDRLPRGHPRPKPVEEMKFMVRHLTKPGQIILDCFCGSGSTLVAAQCLGRQWIGCDKSPAYCRLARKRLVGLQYVTQVS